MENRFGDFQGVIAVFAVLAYFITLAILAIINSPNVEKYVAYTGWIVGTVIGFYFGYRKANAEVRQAIERVYRHEAPLE